MKDENRELVEYVQQLLEKKGRRALDFAKKSVLGGKIHCEEIREALTNFFEYWNELARPSLISICCEAVGGNFETTIPFAASITLICGATDVHDDIIDKSKRKLSHSTIFGKFGQDIALLIGDALLFKGFLILHKASEGISTKQTAQIYNTIENLLFEMGYGEALELKFRGKLDVKLEEYISLVKMKAADIEACARIGAILGSGSEKQINALGKYGRMLGAIIILRDDLADTIDPQEAPYRFKNEPLPLPILIALKDSKMQHEISPILFKRRITRKDLEIISQTIHKTSAVERVEQIIKRMSMQAHNYIKEIPKKDELKSLIDVAVSF
jgi:geranylgeranyl pyrophosphate synthase